MQVAGKTDARTREPPTVVPHPRLFACMPKKGVTCLNVKLQAVKWQLVDSRSSPTTSRTKPTPSTICNANRRSHLPKYGPTCALGQTTTEKHRRCDACATLIALPKNQASTSGDVTFKTHCTLLSLREGRRADPHDNAQRPRREAT